MILVIHPVSPPDDVRRRRSVAAPVILPSWRRPGSHRIFPVVRAVRLRQPAR